MDEDHFLLILSDSALPIGSFAYSSGLESFSVHETADVAVFLRNSIHSLGHTTLPFLRCVYAQPCQATVLDDTLDANTACQVARRASVAQGRALVKLMDRTFSRLGVADNLLNDFGSYKNNIQIYPAKAFGHYAVAFGLAGRILGIGLDKLVQAYLHGHAKAVLSAAVRLSLIGPYESTDILAGRALRETIRQVIFETRSLSIDQTGQTFPILDVLQGRHELLYSRIFSA